MEKKEKKSELEKELVYKRIYLPVRFFKKEAYIHIDDYKEAISKRENAVNGLEKENKKLNIKVASLEGEIKGLNSVIDKLKEENQTLELWLDNKEKVNKKLKEECEKLRIDREFGKGNTIFGM